MATRLALGMMSCALAAGVAANETVTYRYDALGRLVATSSTGSVNNGVATSLAYDPAGNRLTYGVTGAGARPNHPPVTVDDGATGFTCTTTTTRPTDNDSDPDGDPLTLTSVSGAHLGTATVQAGNWVQYQAGNQTGWDVITYTISDGRGGTATGTINLKVWDAGGCG